MKNSNAEIYPYRYFATFRFENHDGSYCYGNSVDEFKKPIRTAEDIRCYEKHILEISLRKNAKHVILLNYVLMNSPKEV